MTCNDCLHGELCISRTDTIFFNKTEYRDLDNVEKFCDDFKNKADFVEVVRCKDCKYLYCFSAIDRQFYCKHYPKGLQGINIVEENPFCSYGERK